MSKPHRGSRYLLACKPRSSKKLCIQWLDDNAKGFHSITPKLVKEEYVPETQSSD